jgi:hypothetical protein
MKWLRDLFEYLGFIGPRRRMSSMNSVSSIGNAVERYQPGPMVTYDEGGGYLTKEDVREEVQFFEEMEEVRLRRTKRAAEAKRIADAAELESEKTATEIERQRAEREGVIGDRDLERLLRPIVHETAEQRALAENARAKADREKADEEHTTAMTNAEIEKDAQKKRYIESVGPSEKQVAELKTREEQEREIEQRAFNIALNASRWAGKTLAEQPPYTEDDGYYALAGVHYYGGRLADLSDGDALTSAARALVDRINRHGPLSQDEAKANARKCKNTRDAWFRKQDKDAKELREQQAAILAAEISRNELQAAALRSEATDKLGNIIKGKRDGEHFDSKA